MDPAQAPAAIEFGRFSVLPHRRELLAEGRPVELGGRAFDVLMALIEASGAVVSKDALMNRVWPDRVVEENGLQAQISSLRRGLRGGPRPDPHNRRARLPIYRRYPHGLGKDRCAGNCGGTAIDTRRAGPADKPAGAGFRTDRPRRRSERDPGSNRVPPPRHPDRHRRHRQDPARLRGRATPAAALCRWGLGHRAGSS